jgi:heme-degrading monooxygenase HmoA
MHARLSTVTGARDIDAGVGYARDVALPQLRQHRGFRGLIVSGNRAAGELVVLELWEGEEDVSASDAVSDQVRTGAMPVVGGDVTVRVYEQVAAEVGDPPPGPGCALRAREVRMAAADVDDNTTFFTSQVMPQMRAAPGFRAVRYLVDRATGQGFVGVVWSDHAALAAGDAAFEKGRQEARATRGVEFGETRIREVLFAAIS